MKKILVITMITVLLSACSSAPAEVVEVNERFVGGSGNSGNRVITDSETGCKYLFHKSANAGGLSPLYKENGEIDCGN